LRSSGGDQSSSEFSRFHCESNNQDWNVSGVHNAVRKVEAEATYVALQRMYAR
jgi:hypothetical protein